MCRRPAHRARVFAVHPRGQRGHARPPTVSHGASVSERLLCQRCLRREDEGVRGLAKRDPVRALGDVPLADVSGTLNPLLRASRAIMRPSAPKFKCFHFPVCYFFVLGSIRPVTNNNNKTDSDTLPGSLPIY